MLKYNFIKTLTAGAILATALYPQAWAADTGSCGRNCVYTYSDGNLTFSPIDSSQGAIISEPVSNYGLSGQVKDAIISEGITSVYSDWPPTIENIGTSDGKLVIPSTLNTFGTAATNNLGFGTIEINSTNLNFEDNSLRFNDAANPNIILSENAQINFSNKTFFHNVDGFKYPASLTISCKGVFEACRAKFGASLDNMDQDKISSGYYTEKDNQGNVTLQYFDNGYRQLNSQGFYDVYDLSGNLTGYSNLEGNEIYDKSGLLQTKYDTDGNLLYKKNQDGSAYWYNSNGKLIGAKKTSPFTPAEAAALIKKGNNNTVKMTVK